MRCERNGVFEVITVRTTGPKRDNYWAVHIRRRFEKADLGLYVSEFMCWQAVFPQEKRAINVGFGFTRGRSPIDMDVELIQQLFGAWEDLRHAIGLVCDLSKAFDCANYETLTVKLRHYAMTGEEPTS
ncbi:hypothetical protein EVAR_96769_1 [Eumeta japonica]|uniref:Reverse transcriptase domain-containing protein n=1 Tax=Eumeta variegata TaxID=151549 RepID=A0A4C1WTF4_EUMVA|nr:hypothetical protein EVAR_96769_1 [Eumeta japonica]